MLRGTKCRRPPLCRASAIVYATARNQGADLLTCDAHFEGLPNVVLFAKTADLLAMDEDLAFDPPKVEPRFQTPEFD